MEILSRSWNSREIGEHGRDVPPRIRGIMIRVQKIRKTNEETRIAVTKFPSVTYPTPGASLSKTNYPPLGDL